MTYAIIGAFAFNLLCGIFAAIFATFKNRDSVGWFLVGLICGPFGLLVAAFPKFEGIVVDADALMKTVLGLIKEGKSVWRIHFKIGIKLADVKHVCLLLFKSGDITREEYERLIGRPLRPNEEENAEPDKKCPFCAEDIKKEAIVCRYCGRDILSSEQKAETC